MPYTVSVGRIASSPRASAPAAASTPARPTSNVLKFLCASPPLRSSPPRIRRPKSTISLALRMGTAQTMTETLTEAQNAAATDPAKGHESVVVIDFGAQYSMLIARRVRELNTYCELIPWDAPAERIAGLDVRGFIFSGGPSSVYDEDAPMAPQWVYDSGNPILGICYGMQLLAHQLGGKVGPGS